MWIDTTTPPSLQTKSGRGKNLQATVLVRGEGMCVGGGNSACARSRAEDSVAGPFASSRSRVTWDTSQAGKRSYRRSFNVLLPRSTTLPDLLPCLPKGMGWRAGAGTLKPVLGAACSLQLGALVVPRGAAPRLWVLHLTGHPASSPDESLSFRRSLNCEGTQGLWPGPGFRAPAQPVLDRIEFLHKSAAG